MIYKLYITEDGAPKTGLTPTWNSLRAIDGTDKSASAPSIDEIGGGWYKFELTYGTAPFDVAELVGVIDAGSSLAGYERYIPVVITLRDLALVRQVNKAVYDTATMTETIYADDGTTIEAKLDVNESNGTQTRETSGG